LNQNKNVLCSTKYVVYLVKHNVVASIKINHIHIPKHIPRQRGRTRKLVLQCIQFCVKEGAGDKRTSAQTLQTTAAKSAKRVEEATEFSEKAIRRILHEKKCHEPQVTKSIAYSGSNRLPKRVADTRLSKVCHSAQNSCFFMCSKERPPTVQKPLTKFRDNNKFKSDKHSLWQATKELGFQSKKMTKYTLVLKQKHNVRCMPITYLRALEKYREDGSAVVSGMIRPLNCTLTGPKDHSDVDCLHKIREGKGSLYCRPEVAVVHSSPQMQPKNSGLPQRNEWRKAVNY